MWLILKIAFTLMIVGMIGASATQSRRGKIEYLWMVFIGMFVGGFFIALVTGLKWMWFDAKF